MNSLQCFNACRGKHVLFVTTKEQQYIRNVQEIALLQDVSESVRIIASDHKQYLIRILYAYWGLLIYGLCSKKTEVVFIGFSPQLLWLLWAFVKRSQKIICIDFFISVYDTLVDDRKKIKPNSVFARFCLWLDRFIWHGAEYIIVDTQAHGAYFQELLGPSQGTLEVLYLSADTTRYHHPDQVPDTYHVIFFGSILPVQGVDVILKALQYVLMEEPNMKITLIGPLDRLNDVPKITGPHVTYYKWVDQTTLAEILQTGTLGLAGHFSATVGKAKRTIAGKTYIYLAVGLPVILGDSPANRERFFPSEQHLFVPLGDATALAGQILKHYTLWKERNEQS